MSNIDKQALRNSALEMIRVLGYIASFESEDIDGDYLELRFDTGCTISIVSQCQDAADVIQQLLNELDAAEKRIAELEARKADLYLCRVIRNGEELYSPCGKDYPRGRGYFATGISIKGSE